MARLTQLSDTSWEQPFRDRKKEHLLWGSHPAVREHCKFVDGTRRLLQIAFEPRFDLDIVDYFQITSGREIQFPKVLVEMIRHVVLKNPESSFIVTVLDANEHENGQAGNEQDVTNLIPDAVGTISSTSSAVSIPKRVWGWVLRKIRCRARTN